MKKTAVLLFSFLMLVIFIGCPEDKKTEETKKVDPRLIGGYYREITRQQFPQSTLYFYNFPSTNAKLFKFTETTISTGTYTNNQFTSTSTRDAYCKNGNIYYSDDTLIFSYETVPMSFFDPEWNAANPNGGNSIITSLSNYRTWAQQGRILRFTAPDGTSTLLNKQD
jgi:hypothetical protein